MRVWTRGFRIVVALSTLVVPSSWAAIADINPDGDATGDNVAVSVGGNATSGCADCTVSVAVSVGGNATGDTAAVGTEGGSGGDVRVEAATRVYVEGLVVAVDGPTNGGGLSLSLQNNSTAGQLACPATGPFCVGGVALAPQGEARSPGTAISGTGNATGGPAAFSATGNSYAGEYNWAGLIAGSGFGYAESDFLAALSITGDSKAPIFTLSGAGDARGSMVAISGGGEAEGSVVSLSVCKELAACDLPIWNAAVQLISQTLLEQLFSSSRLVP